MAIVRTHTEERPAGRPTGDGPFVEACRDLDDLLSRTEQWLFAEIERTRTSALFIPAGRTPLPLYRRWEATRPPILRDLQLCPVDEVVTGPGAGMFSRFLREALPSYTDAIVPVADAPEPLPRVALLGLGLNGHVAFHEPHVPREFRKGIVDLEHATCAELGLDAPVQGLSYGVGTFGRCDSVAIVVSSERKRVVLQRLLRGDVMPARWLLDTFLGADRPQSRFMIFAEASLLSPLSATM